MAWLIYLVRRVLRGIGNRRPRLARAPKWVVFTLQESYTELPPPGSKLQRKLFQRTPDLRELGEQLRQVAADSRVDGVVLRLPRLALSLATVQTIAGYVGELQEAGKRVVAWGTTLDTPTYVLAASCDEVLLQPGGVVAPLGVRQSFVHLAEGLERLGLRGDFVQISPYKSAADPVMRTEMSPELREMANWLADSTYTQVLRTIAAGRGISEARARTLVDGAPYTSEEALRDGVVDDVLGEEALPRHLGVRASRVRSWDEARKRLRKLPSDPPGKHVALVRIEGSIVDGESKRPPISPPGGIPFLGERAGERTVVQDVRKALKDRRAGAVVLWVDSGGGSATSSEAMAAALDELDARKPVVACMGPVAGSGGYYVTTPARWVVAQPGTLTGSIGVLSGKLVNDGLFGKLRANRELVTRGARVTLEHPARPYTDEERKVVWNGISSIYGLFCDRVAKARGMTPDAVDRVAGGRVWTGEQALERGLVDELGGLDQAIAKARELGGLGRRAKVKEIRTPKRKLSQPVEPAAAMIPYAFEAMELLEGRAQCLVPLVFLE